MKTSVHPAWKDEDRVTWPITKVEAYTDGNGYAITTAAGWGTGIDDNEAGLIMPKIGDLFIVWPRSPFGVVRGIAINGTVIRYHPAKAHQ